MAELLRIVLLICSLFVFSKCIEPYEEFTQPRNEYTLPELPYKYDGLEPYIDEATLRVHHLGHHSAYTKKMNAALADWRESGQRPNLASKSILEIMKNIHEVPDNWQNAIRNNGGGFINHAFYWAVMSPNEGKEPRQPTGKIAELIDSTYGNFSSFKKFFNDEASSLFGSGYTWLCQDVTSGLILPEQVISMNRIIIVVMILVLGYLSLLNMINQESPVSYKLNPVLVIDLWEHAYYLKYQNKRAGYIENWWRVVDWSKVNQLLEWWDKQRPHDEL